MSLAGLLVFAAAYLVAVASPGPGVAALVARVLARGPTGVGAFIAGFVAGDLVWFALAATGLAILATTFAPLFVAIRYAGAAYLLVLAWWAWTAPARPLDVPTAGREEPGRLFLAGLALTLGNPKVILFFLALLPSIVDLTGLGPLAYAELGLTIVVVLSGVLAAYATAAARARRLFTSAAAIRRVNRGTAMVMAGAALAVAAR